MIHLVVIKSDTCGCCHDFLEMLNNYVKIHKEVTFEESDISKHPDRDIKGLPYTIVYRNNVEVGVILGNMRMDMFDMRLKEYN